MKKIEYHVTLTARVHRGQYTAYLGASRVRANEAMDVVRNTLIRVGATGMATLTANRKTEQIQVVMDGTWAPTLKAFPEVK